MQEIQTAHTTDEQRPDPGFFLSATAETKRRIAEGTP